MVSLTGGMFLDAHLRELRESDKSIEQGSTSEEVKTASSNRIFLNPFPTKVFYDYDPDEVDVTDGNIFCPMDDLEGAPVKICEKTAGSLSADLSMSEPHANCTVAKDIHSSLPDISTAGQFDQCPMGVKEAGDELRILRQKYHAANQRKNIETRTWDGVTTCYARIWNEIRRRARMGLNYIVFFVYNTSAIATLEKLLIYDSFTVLRLPCKGKEGARLYVAYDVDLYANG
jgi:hypothetical protein